MHERGQQLAHSIPERGCEGKPSSSAISCGIAGGGVQRLRHAGGFIKKTVVGLSPEIGTLARRHGIDIHLHSGQRLTREQANAKQRCSRCGRCDRFVVLNEDEVVDSQIGRSTYSKEKQPQQALQVWPPAVQAALASFPPFLVFLLLFSC